LDTKRQQFDGYYLIQNESDKTLKMVLQGSWKTEYTKIFSSKNITGLRLSESNGWNDTSISFISDLKTINDLEIYNWNITDISPVVSLPQLKHISLECNYRKPVDFSTFTELQSLFIRWRPKSDSIFSAPSLESLNIVNYPYEDLTHLQQLHQLTELKLTSNKLKQLMGIEQLTALSSLDLYRCTKLESLNGIQKTHTLTKLDIESCKKIGSLEPLNTLTELTRVLINNCGKVRSLTPLISSNKLSEIFFIEDTNIEDGNTGIFTQLPSLKTMWFADRKHYSHKREDVQKKLNTC